jgi:hypothetical protein
VKQPVVRLKIRVRIADESRSYFDPVRSGKGKLKSLYPRQRRASVSHLSGSIFFGMRTRPSEYGSTPARTGIGERDGKALHADWDASESLSDHPLGGTTFEDSGGGKSVEGHVRKEKSRRVTALVARGVSPSKFATNLGLLRNYRSGCYNVRLDLVSTCGIRGLSCSFPSPAQA